MVSIDEKIAPREKLGVVVGQRVQISHGSHKGRLARIAAVHPRAARDGAALVDVTLANSDSLVRDIHEDDIVLL